MKSRQIDPERLPPGTYLNTGEAASRGLAINRFCYDLKRPENRERYKADPDGEMERYGNDPVDRDLIRAKDWLALVKRGANVFVLLRLSLMHGDSLTATGAQMRGETVEEYLASRKIKAGASLTSKET